MSVSFYAEDLNINQDQAAKVAWFMQIAKDMNPKPWRKNSLIRVYFTPWSQNRFSAFRDLKQWFYDVSKNEVYVSGTLYGNYTSYTLNKALSFGTNNFAGAKTKAKLMEFSQNFYGQNPFKD